MHLDRLTDTRSARLDGVELSPGACAFDVLAHLHLHADRVVTKAEFLDHVRSVMIVEEGNLSVRIAGLRKAPGEAVACFEQALSEHPEFVTAVQGVLSCRFALGEIAEARHLAGIYGAKAPQFPVREYIDNRPFESSDALQFVVDAMRAPGFPETPEDATDALQGR